MLEEDNNTLTGNALAASQALKTRLRLISQSGEPAVPLDVAKDLERQLQDLTQQIAAIRQLPAETEQNQTNALHRLEEERESLQMDIRVIVAASQRAAEKERQQKLFGEMTSGATDDNGYAGTYNKMNQYSQMLNTSVQMSRAGVEELNSQTGILERLQKRTQGLNAKIGVGLGIMKDIFKVNSGNKIIWISGTALIVIIIVLLMIFQK